MQYSQPKQVSVDTVIPLHSMDDDEVFRSTILDISFLFNDVLDPSRLHDSLWKLLTTGKWRKLGARLRMNSNGKLDYHIPAVFDTSRPPFKFIHESVTSEVENHLIGYTLVSPSSSPSVLSQSDRPQRSSQDSDTPTSIEQFLSSDLPQLTVRVKTFDNATLLTVIFPHTLMDGMALRALFDNWIAVLEGRDSEVQPLHGYDFDPLASLGVESKGHSSLAKWQTSYTDMLEFQQKAKRQLQMPPMAEENGVIFLPSQFVQSIKQQALRNLALHGGDNSEKLFLSDGDIVSAWWTQVLISALNPPGDQLVAIRNSFSLRGTLIKDLLPEGRAYMANAIMGLYAFLPAQDILEKPLSFVASSIRKGIMQQTTRDQVEAFAAMTRDSRLTTGKRPMFGNSNTIQIMLSNLVKLKFFNMDFSAALAKQGLPLNKRLNLPGRPVYQEFESHYRPFHNCYVFPIMGKDHGGNYWLTGRLPRCTWDEVKKILHASL